MAYNTIQIIAVAAIPLIFAITVHEAAHGWVASKFGDSTALMLGRVTLNPIKHIDLFGTIIIPAMMLMLGGIIFGWAKPVPVNWQNLKNPRRDKALVALAGPAANLLMALMWAALAKISFIIYNHPSATGIIANSAMFIHLASKFGITLNIILMCLNLLPIPPLDGSRVIASFLPPKAEELYERIEPYGIWILLALLFLRVLGLILWPPIFFFLTLIKNLFGLP